MSIHIGGINLADSVINTEFRLSVLERVVDKLLLTAHSGTLTVQDMEKIRKEVLESMQKKYPEAGIGLKNGG
jgi:hypothetical protein